jgi:hypothetical protein
LPVTSLFSRRLPLVGVNVGPSVRGQASQHVAL